MTDHTTNGHVPAEQVAAIVELERVKARGRTEYDAQLWRDVQERVRRLRIDDRARAELATEQRESDLSALPTAVTLADALKRPREGPKWRVDGLLHAGGNATLVAVQKAGKTTLVGNLLRSLVDGVPFLGVHETVPVEGTVALLNYEMDEQLQTEWLGATGIERTDRVVCWPFKGHRVPLLDRPGIEWMAGQLRAVGAEVAVIDPFGAAYLSAGGTDMDSNNTVVGQFLRGLDELKRLSGVRELVMPAHAKRDATEGAERARGPAILGDWPEALWVLTRDASERRFFRATEGRDINVPECQLALEEGTKRLSVAGGGRAATRRSEVRDAVLGHVREHSGCGKAEVEDALCGEHARADVRAVIADLLRTRRVHQETGARGKHLLRPVDPEEEAL